MRKVLFVDDEARILDGLRRMMRPLRREWEVRWAESGAEALRVLEEFEADVIVSDMRMPGMGGAELLSECKRLHPDMVRIVLSGHSELESALQSIAVAHQFLSKPSDAAQIRHALSRAAELLDLLRDEKLRELVGRIDRLPVLPRTYHDLTACLDDPSCSIADVAKIVQPDGVLVAKVLQIVNSAFLGAPQRVSDLATAIRTIGVTMLRNLVLYLDVVRCFENGAAPRGFSLRQHQDHAARVAHLAQRILAGDPAAGDAFMAGMLHDIGSLILVIRAPELYERVQAGCAERESTRVRVEREQIGYTHAEIGGYLLGLWGLPHPVVEAVAKHHAPRDVAGEGLSPLAAVHVADALIDAGETGGFEAALDRDYLARLGVEDRLPEWRRWAEEILQADLAEGRILHV